MVQYRIPEPTPENIILTGVYFVRADNLDE